MINKKIRLILLIAIVMGIMVLTIGCSTDQEKVNGSEETVEENGTADQAFIEINTSNPMETLKTLIRIYFFDEGSYEDYGKLYIDQNQVRSEEEFNQYREENDPQDMFPAGYESVEAVMNHMREVEIDEITVEIHYVEDPEQEGADGSMFYWIIIKEDDQWLVY